MKARGRGYLKRRSATRNPLAVFHVFCEGSNTEKDYLAAFQKTLGGAKVRIKYYGPNGVPLSVAKEAIDFAKGNGLIKKKRRRKLNSFEENDTVWAVFDRDEHPCYAAAKTKCDGADVQCIFSDPCFELWLALHFESYDAPCNSYQIQGAVKNLVVGYDPKAGKTADFSQLMGDVKKAEKLAKKQRRARADEGNPDGNPSTNFYKLTLALRDGNY